MSKLFILYDGWSCISGDTTKVSVLDTALTETEAFARSMAWEGDDHIWYEYDFEHDMLKNGKQRRDIVLDSTYY